MMLGRGSVRWLFLDESMEVRTMFIFSFSFSFLLIFIFLKKNLLYIYVERRWFFVREVVVEVLSLIDIYIYIADAKC